MMKKKYDIYFNPNFKGVGDGKLETWTQKSKGTN